MKVHLVLNLRKVAWHCGNIYVLIFGWVMTTLTKVSCGFLYSVLLNGKAIGLSNIFIIIINHHHHHRMFLCCPVTRARKIDGPLLHSYYCLDRI